MYLQLHARVFVHNPRFALTHPHPPTAGSSYSNYFPRRMRWEKKPPQKVNVLEGLSCSLEFSLLNQSRSSAKLILSSLSSSISQVAELFLKS